MMYPKGHKISCCGNHIAELTRDVHSDDVLSLGQLDFSEGVFGNCSMKAFEPVRACPTCGTRDWYYKFSNGNKRMNVRSHTKREIEEREYLNKLCRNKTYGLFAFVALMIIWIIIAGITRL